MSPVETHPPPAEAPASRSARDATFDILKGIGIAEVMIHHLLSFSARKYAAPDSVDWWTMTVANRILHFAVPTFLLASALLLARSVANKPQPDWKRFYARRAQRTLWPFLVWSCLYLLFRIYVVRIGSDVLTTPVALPLIGTVAMPTVLVSAQAWYYNLFWGRAYFHLYFMTVLLQFLVAFPLLFLVLRRLTIGFGGVLLLSAILQGTVFWFQSTYLRLPFPASMALWHTPALLIGVWLGLNWPQWETIWRSWRLSLVLGTLAGFVVYMALSMIQLTGGRISSLPFNVGITLYATGMALLLLAGARHLAKGSRTGSLLARIGDRSLALYLVHPMILYLISGPTITAFLSALPFTPLWAGALMLAVTWGFSSLARRLRLDRLLFGR